MEKRAAFDSLWFMLLNLPQISFDNFMKNREAEKRC